MDELVVTAPSGEKFCRPCQRWFKDYTSALQHVVHSNAHGHCERCDRDFDTYIAKNQHIASSGRHNICHLQGCRDHYSDGADFPSHAALLEHFRKDKTHHYCFSCKEDFDSDQQLSYHVEVSNNHHWCTRCSRDFISDAALLQHLQSSSLHFLCRVCKRDFTITNELAQVNQPIRPLPKQREAANLPSAPKSPPASLPIKCACTFKFTCLSALIIHWEAGKCTTNRQFLNKLVITFPEHRRFTVAEHISDLNGTNTRPRSGDEYHYNSYSREWFCPIDDCHVGFQTLNVLDQHLRSPLHDEMAFKCPNADCDMRFNCLSGLLQHVENTNRCSEDINSGTGCLGRLWLFLLEKFDMLPSEDVIDMFQAPSVGFIGYAQRLTIQ